MRLIAGSGRSGTTWVQDALADANGLRPIFEPLHPWASDVGARFAHRALSADEDHLELRRFLVDVCAGRHTLLWTRYRGQGRLLFPSPSVFASRGGLVGLVRRWQKFLQQVPDLRAASRRPAPLVKDIRANLMLGWLSRQCACRTVLILRHPGAVIESELRERWVADAVLDYLRRDDRLHELTGGRYRALLGRQLSVVEALAARWVIENQWPVERAVDDDVTVVHYERLKSSPETEWLRACRALALDQVPSEAARARPSQQSAVEGSAASHSSLGPPGWMRRLTRQQIDEVQGVLDAVGFTLYSMDDPTPRDAPAPAAAPLAGVAC